LWYLTRYLRMARLDYPSAYQLIADDACWREAVLSVWGRAWRTLDKTDVPQSSLRGELLLALAADPVLVCEIARLRAKAGCAP
jgi:hypothetical protein